MNSHCDFQYHRVKESSFLHFWKRDLSEFGVVGGGVGEMTMIVSSLCSFPMLFGLLWGVNFFMTLFVAIL